MFEVVDIHAVGAGQAQVHLVRLGAARKLVGLEPEEGRAYLVREVVGIHSEHASAVFELQTVLALAGPQVVAEVDHPGVAVQPVTQVRRCRFDLFQVRADQTDIDGAPTRSDGGLGEFHPNDVGHRAGLFAPAVAKLVHGGAADLGAQQVDHDAGDVRSGLVGVRVLAEQHRQVLDQVLSAGLCRPEVLVDRSHHAGEVGDHGLGACQRRTLRQQNACLHQVALDIREPGELQLAANRHRHGQQEQHQDNADRQVAVIDGAIEQRAEALIAKVCKATFEGGAEAAGLTCLHV